MNCTCLILGKVEFRLNAKWRKEVGREVASNCVAATNAAVTNAAAIDAAVTNAAAYDAAATNYAATNADASRWVQGVPEKIYFLQYVLEEGVNSWNFVKMVVSRLWKNSGLFTVFSRFWKKIWSFHGLFMVLELWKDREMTRIFSTTVKRPWKDQNFSTTVKRPWKDHFYKISANMGFRCELRIVCFFDNWMLRPHLYWETKHRNRCRGNHFHSSRCRQRIGIPISIATETNYSVARI